MVVPRRDEDEDLDLDGPVVTEYLTPPLEEEDWEEELNDSHPYGAQDVIRLERSPLDGLPWQEESLYNPASHHAPPVRWVLTTTPTVPGQFEDIEDGEDGEE
ncbi:coordinator of PRMT5 and differentiation stimulator [Acipenser oxyrinchus oxyrinchus]|uniref:Coordinator of PRMT5 and differentiation stimulator n=1 Tax=Acipenser oxyrinchus oxyrinchus TaxID=40147 RepID=A0AAD8G259_ACIOX|nr:coordinator of PRMT5 and differentiation stimulator [Acipenser oxyrinchus oxyrinchus]